MDEALPLFPTLELLNLKENHLGTIQSLAGLAKLEDLVELRVEGNPLCSADYRARVSEVLPNLEVLDGVSVASCALADRRFDACMHTILAALGYTLIVSKAPCSVGLVLVGEELKGVLFY